MTDSLGGYFDQHKYKSMHYYYIVVLLRCMTTRSHLYVIKARLNFEVILVLKRNGPRRKNEASKPMTHLN